MKVVVASKNPVKLEAVRAGFEQMFGQELIDVLGVAVHSGVAKQPMSDMETRMGAMNRAEEARRLAADADYWVGVEGGVEEDELGLMAFAWVVVRSVHGVGYGKTGTFFLPPQVANLVRQGKELGEADDVVFGRVNSKQENGAIGLLTRDVINRASLYQPAVVMALIPFCNPQLYLG